MKKGLNSRCLVYARSLPNATLQTRGDRTQVLFGLTPVRCQTRRQKKRRRRETVQVLFSLRPFVAERDVTRRRGETSTDDVKSTPVRYQTRRNKKKRRD